MNARKRKVFRELLSGNEIIVAPGAYDVFSGRIIEAAGFKVVYAGGANIDAVMGNPDGESSRDAYLGRLREIAAAVETPVVVDIDTGLGSGSAVDLMKTVRECEQMGVAAVHFEDQVTALKVGGYKGAYSISRDEMIKKIEAAQEARVDDNFVLIARTDSRTRYGLEEALERGRMFAKAGADMVVVQALQTVDELKRAVDYVGAPLVIYNGATKPGDYGNKLTFLTARELQDIGVKLVTFANGVIRIVGKSIQDLMEEIQLTGTDNGLVDRMLTKGEVHKLVRTPELEALRQRFMPADEKVG